jgi:hypothetical protein
MEGEVRPEDLRFNFYFIPGTLQGISYLFLKALERQGAALVDLHDNEVLSLGVAADRLKRGRPYLAFTREGPDGQRLAFTLRAGEAVGALHIHFSLGPLHRSAAGGAQDLEDFIVGMVSDLYAQTLPALAYADFEAEAGASCGACVRHEGRFRRVDLTTRTFTAPNLLSLYSKPLVEAFGDVLMSGHFHRREVLPDGGLLVMVRPLSPGPGQALSPLPGRTPSLP